MTRLIAAAVMLVALAAPAWAGFDEGLAAYKRGDYATALHEWRPLAEQGYADAQYNLGLMYHSGKGVPQDFVRAYMWFNLPLGKDHDAATEARDDVAKRMTPAQIAEAQRLAREWWERHRKK